MCPLQGERGWLPYGSGSTDNSLVEATDRIEIPYRQSDRADAHRRVGRLDTGNAAACPGRVVGRCVGRLQVGGCLHERAP